jgi:hypothetical protein
MPSLPDFDARGLLPPGDHAATFDELRASTLVVGPAVPIEGWDHDWRRHLVDQAEVLVRQLWAVGITEVYLDGSFAEDKPHPNDVDGYFVCDVFRFAGGDLQRELNALDPRGIWTWDPASRRPYRGYTKRQLPMWHAYRVELYPHYGQLSGITGRHGHPKTFPAAFRERRFTDEEKGIVRVVPD